MERRHLRAALTIPLMVALGATAASAQADRRDQPETRYVITELGGLGGGDGAAISINNRGLISGYSLLPDGRMNAAMWRRDGSAVSLGTLGGENSAILWPVENERGLLVGVSETSDLDPRDEAWSCSAFFGVDNPNACVGFVWERGEMRDLPTFGGPHGFALGANNRGLVVGWAEVDEVDPKCNQVDQFLGFKPAVWDTRAGDRIHELPTLPGDSAGTANAINDRGQIVGISGICSNAVGGFSARAAVMWDDGKVIDLGNLGGEAWNTPMAINHEGMVVGFGNKAGTEGDRFNEEAWVWTEEDGMTGVGFLPGDSRSQALGVNTHDQVVGLSRQQDRSGLRAFLWQDGAMADLNDLTDYDGHLLFANDINDAGVIVGAAVSESGEGIGFVATPTRSRR